MEAITEILDGAEVIRLRGKLDSTNAADFDAQLRALGKAENLRCVVLEMSGIITLTSAPLRNILSLTKRLRQTKLPLFLAAPSENCLEALQISGFLQLKLFEIKESVDAVRLMLSALPVGSMPISAEPTAIPPRSTPAPVQPKSPVSAAARAPVSAPAQPAPMPQPARAPAAAPTKSPPVPAAQPAPPPPAPAPPPPPPLQEIPLKQPVKRHRGPIAELGYALSYWLKKLIGR